MGRKRQGSDGAASAVVEGATELEVTGDTTFDMAKRMADGENMIPDTGETGSFLPVKASTTLASPSPKAQLNLSGKYIAQCGIKTDDGKEHLPGAELQLSDADARHFLKLHAVKLVVEVPAGGPASAVNLPVGVNLSGEYEALVVLKHGEGDETQPGETVTLSDTDARHFLKQRAIKIAEL